LNHDRYAVAGRLFRATARLPQNGSISLESGTCFATLAGRRFLGQGSLATTGGLSCEWKLPTSSAGKHLWVRLRAGQTSSDAFSTVVRPLPAVEIGHPTFSKPYPGGSFEAEFPVLISDPGRVLSDPRPTATCRIGVVGSAPETAPTKQLDKTHVACSTYVPS